MTTKWSIDPTHSEIQFKVKHLMISTVTGQFNNFTSSFESEENDFTKAKVNFEADVDSISTNNAQRDAHLKNGDFFEADKHPKITFESKQIEKTGEEEYRMHGILSMRGVAKPVSLNVEYGGETIDPWGNKRVGFSLNGKVNRIDFGVGTRMANETGGLILGEEIKISASTEFVLQANVLAA